MRGQRWVVFLLKINREAGEARQNGLERVISDSGKNGAWLYRYSL
jgi:hypothetical protein